MGVRSLKLAFLRGWYKMGEVSPFFFKLFPLDNER